MRPVFYPRLSRFDLGVIRGPGPGLGNLLFPVARSLGYAAACQGHVIAPTWRNLKLGPWLRREVDLRTYGNIFKHRRIREVATGVFQRLVFRPRISEDRYLDERAGSSDGHALVVVEGMRKEFEDLSGLGPIVRQWLEARSLRPVARPDEPFIGVHIRMGDFSKPESTGYHRNTRIEVSWFLDEIQRVRRSMGSLPVHIFSDASPESLSPTFSRIDRVTVRPSVNALTDLLGLSEARHVIASNSTFSLWSAFLGEGTVSARYTELFHDYGLTARTFLDRVR